MMIIVNKKKSLQLNFENKVDCNWMFINAILVLNNPWVVGVPTKLINQTKPNQTIVPSRLEVVVVEYSDCISAGGGGKTPHQEYHFIAITLRSILAQSGSTW